MKVILAYFFIKHIFRLFILIFELVKVFLLQLHPFPCQIFETLFNFLWNYIFTGLPREIDFIIVYTLFSRFLLKLGFCERIFVFAMLSFRLRPCRFVHRFWIIFTLYLYLILLDIEYISLHFLTFFFKLFSLNRVIYQVGDLCLYPSIFVLNSVDFVNSLFELLTL